MDAEEKPRGDGGGDWKEAETGRRRPPAQGRTPGAPRSWKRRGEPSPGASAGSSALGLPDLRRVVPRTGAAGRMSV